MFFEYCNAMHQNLQSTGDFSQYYADSEGKIIIGGLLWILLEPVAIPARNAYEIPDEVIFFHDDKSVVGHAQRNTAIERISGGHVYFLDDDTIMHPDFWNELKKL